jgi:aspartate/methionine/tyrosine aminotransferase
MAPTPRFARRVGSVEPFRVVEVMQKAWALEATGRHVVHLEVGEPDFGTPAPVVEAAARAIAGGRVHYTPALGTTELREAISGYYEERFGIDLPARRIVITTGASGALLLALAATVDAGDEVLLTDPGYPCNRNFARLCGATPTSVPVGPTSAYQFTADLVGRRWGPQTRSVLLATPSNPTGTLVPPDELRRIVAEANDRGGVAYVDEIYGELVYNTEPATVLSQTYDVFVVNSFSKTFGMTGWRLGWLVCPDWALPGIEALAQNLYISPPAPAQSGAVAAFTAEVWAEVARRRKAFADRRDLLVAGLERLGFGLPVIPDGAFYVYAECDRFGADSAALAEHVLTGAGVAVTPGVDFGTFGAERHLRFSYTTSAEMIELALERMGRLLLTD